MTTFRERANLDIDTPKSAANDLGARRLAALRDRAVSEYPVMDDMRDRARSIRLHTLSSLDSYLSEFAESVARVGGHVFFAGDADEAKGYITALAADRGVKKAVKSKSMVTEEIELNDALDAAGVDVVETDLGEFIVQLSGDTPSHIIAPVLHWTRFGVGELFAEKIDAPYTDDPIELNSIARAHLRKIFLEADMGISGVNFGVASTGSICTVTNEGNGRLSTTAPRIHVAVMGMERLVPTPGDLAVMLEVLARSATGQRLSVYTNIVTGPRRPGDPDGPDEFHVVILDNGRSRVLGSPESEILACIRCGACLNICPVYREVGGHAYGSVYSGPVGAVLTPALMGKGFDLPFASSLCGACQEVCPVRIDIPRMLLNLRARSSQAGDSEFRWLRAGLSAYARAASHPVLWRSFLGAGSIVSRTTGRSGWVRKLPWHAGAWTESRDLISPARQSFHSWWKANRGT